MTAIPEPVGRVVAFLGELGPRWGLPADACRVHGYLYLVAKPTSVAELRKALALTESAFDTALAWLADYRLIRRADGAHWVTDSDPWELMVRSLEERQRRELAPALALLRDCYERALRERASRTTASQIGKLLGLAEDIASINTQARRLSPASLRRLIGLGGIAGRFVDRAFGGRRP